MVHGQDQVNFTFHSRIKRHLFHNVRLDGSWGDGRFSNQWTQVPMAASGDETGCDALLGVRCTGVAQIAGSLREQSSEPSCWVVQAARRWGKPPPCQD